MALTLDISPDMETLLRLKAAKSGQDVTGYLLGLVKSDLSVELSEYDGMEDYAASVAGVQAGIEDMEAGRTYSSEEAYTMIEEDKARWRKEKAQNRRHSQPAAGVR